MTAIFEAGDPRRELFLTAQFGVELESAKETTLYKFLTESAADRADIALAALVTCEPTDTARIMSLQNEVKRLRDIEAWLDFAIQSGRTAHAELAQRDYE